MNISESEHLKLLTELLIAINPILIAAFILGILFGVLLFSNLIDRLTKLSDRFRRPHRIKHSLVDGDFEYLYLFRGRYYSLIEYQDLRREVRRNFINKKNC